MVKRSSGVLILGCAFMLCASLTEAAAPLLKTKPSPYLPDDERALVEIIADIHDGEIDRALEGSTRLVERNPAFKAAQLVRADLLAAKARLISTVGDLGGIESPAAAALRQEIATRLRHALRRAWDGSLPSELVQLAPTQTSAIVVDVSHSRLYLFERRNDSLALVGDRYVTIGKEGAYKTREGDQKTPVGIYFVTGRMVGDALPELYGAGAFPINYPNEWDAKLGRTGYGIWLHGVPFDTYSRTPKASDGCLALPNADVQDLWSVVTPGSTPVVITDGVQWTDRADLSRRARQVRARLERWVSDWESMDFERYARNYSREFWSGDGDYRSWLDRKRRINAGKTFIEVELSDVSILAYPRERDMLVVSFQQSYASSNYRSQSMKRQYWRLESDGHWRILYEGTAAFSDIHRRGIPYSARLEGWDLD